MNRHDLPPGHRLIILSGEVGEGDVLHESGSRIGQRFWLVVFVERARKWWHAACMPLSVDDADGAVRDGAKRWTLVPEPRRKS